MNNKVYICGQTEFLNKVNSLVENDRFPRFAIICGGSGHGKKVISEYIANSLEANFVPCDVSVDKVRTVIENSYTINQKTLYMFFDCDEMSSNAMNAMLKLTEEPPNNSYFIMTVQDTSNLLQTLISRGTVFNLSPYSTKEIDDFIIHKGYKFSESEWECVLKMCVCPKDVIDIANADIKSIYELSKIFVEFIGKANLANTFKIPMKLSTKKDDGKINPLFFLRSVMYYANNLLTQSAFRGIVDTDLIKIISHTSKCISDVSTKGVNIQIALDSYILRLHMSLTGNKF